MEEKKKAFIVRLPEELKKAIHKICIDMDISLNTATIQALTNWYEINKR